MQILKKNLALHIAVLLILISLLDEILPGIRYAKYLTIPFCLIIATTKGFRLNAQSSAGLWPFGLYLLAMIPYLVLNQVTNMDITADDAVFLLAYLLPLAFLPVCTVNIKNTFLASTIFFLFVSFGKLGGDFNFNILESGSSFEHSEFGFIFSFFLLYFVTRGEFKLAIIATILAILSLKRIALLGSIVAWAIYAINPERLMPRKQIAIIAALVNVAIIFLMKFTTTEEFNSLIYELTEKSANHFTMGRSTLYSFIFDHTSIQWFYGIGPGAIYSFASSAFDSSNRVLLHSDLLKLGIELGAVFLFMFFYMLYKERKLALEQIVLLNIILLTDNVLIYASVMFFFFILATRKTSTPTIATQ